MSSRVGSSVCEEFVIQPARHSGQEESSAYGVEAELAKYLPQFNRMSKQLKQTSQQIEDSVVGVCGNFHGIAERARSAVARTSDILGLPAQHSSGKPSFEELLENCSQTMVKVLGSSEEAGELSRRAIARIQQMDQASQSINTALEKLERIAHENKMLAMNARIEAAHAGVHGVGFAVVAVEVAEQTKKSEEVTVHVGGLIANLRSLAASTLMDLQKMNDRDHQRLTECRREVDDSLRDLQTTHGEMKSVLTGITAESELLANDIGAAVRGLQFQDRISQQVAHVIDDLETMHNKISSRFGENVAVSSGANDGFSDFTMFEERQIAGIGEAESVAGDVELF